MTVDTHPETPDNVARDAERLHEYAVNDLNYNTYDVLFTANPDGSIDGEIRPEVAVD